MSCIPVRQLFTLPGEKEEAGGEVGQLMGQCELCVMGITGCLCNRCRESTQILY